MSPLALAARSCRSLAAPALLLLVSGVGACAAGRGRGAAAPAKVVAVDMDPVRVEVSRDRQGRAATSTFDARELFDQAGAALESDRYDRALELYDRLIESFPTSRLLPAALFNAGLALEGKRDLDAAVVRYLAVVGRAGATRHGLDAHLRAAAVLAEQTRWSESLRVLEEVAARRDLDSGDRVELSARRGYALLESGHPAEAERALTDAIELAGGAARDGRPATRYFVAMAHYYLGEIPRREAEAMPLRLPEERLQRDVEEKSRLILAAERHFVDTIRAANLHWATAAGYQLGAMQEEMWRALLASPVPPRLNREEARAYLAEVRTLARVNLSKALSAHERNAELAKRKATETPWSEASRRRAAELRALVDANTGASRLPPPGPVAR